LLNSSEVECIVCTYHQECAYDAIKYYLEELNFRVSHSDGYMWFHEHFNRMRPPVLRRGLIKAKKMS